MKLKLDDAGNAVLKDGMPVYIHDDGKELPFDAPNTLATITRLNGEAKTHRTAKEAAEAKLAAFAGIDDPAAALTALNTIKNFDDKKLVDAGKVEEIKREINTAWETKMKDKDTALESLTNQLRGEKIGGSFVRSKYIADNLAIPADIVEASFGKHFKLEDGVVKAYGPDGNPVYSRAKPGTIADFDEAMEILVDSYPHKNSILKAEQRSGSGAQPGAGGGQGGAKQIKRSAFDALDAAGRADHVKGGGVVVD